jgi:protein TonB
MAGAKISGPEPQYPVWARNARISGEVVLRAIISKTGTVKDLAVLSGPSALRESALDAVGKWRYRPFLLNGKPIDVQTMVTVKFSLGYGY